MKKLFTQYQRQIVSLANNPFGRRFLEIPHEFKDKRIVKVTPNYFMVDTGRTKRVNGVWKMIVRSHARTYPVYAQKLGVALSCLEILHKFPEYMRLDKYAGLINYALDLRDNKFPQILLTQANYYAGAGDGNVLKSDATYATARSAATGTAVTQTDDTGWGAATSYNIWRGFYPVDTSGIADTETSIDAAVFNVYINSLGGGTHTAALIQTTQASGATLATSDYDNITLNSPSEGATRLASGSMTTSAYNAITLNSTGRAWISVSAYTFLGIREGTYDVDNAQPGAGTFYANVSFSSHAGTSQDPYLDVTSTVPASGAFFAFIN